MLLPFGELNFALDMRSQAGLGILGLLLRNLPTPCKHNRHRGGQRHVPSGAYSPHRIRPGGPDSARYTLHSPGSPSLAVVPMFAIFTKLIRSRYSPSNVDSQSSHWPFRAYCLNPT